MKQIGLALMQYTQDYDEAFPPAIMVRDTTGANVPPGGIWSNDHWYWQQNAYAYLKSTEVLACPSSSLLGISRSSGHYGVNQIIMPSAATTAPLKLAAIQSNAETYLAMDYGSYVASASYTLNARGRNNYLPGFGNASGRGDCGLTADVLNTEFYGKDCQSGRHFGGVNMLFADGHAKWLKSETVLSEARQYRASDHRLSAWDPLSN